MKRRLRRIWVVARRELRRSHATAFLEPTATPRIIADAAMTNVALVLALSLRWVWLILVEASPAPPSILLARFIEAYARAAFVLTAIATLVFALNGFYTRGLAYRSRYKALVVVQAVSLVYLIFGALSYFTQRSVELPRGVYAIAWTLTIVMLVSSRVWATLWAGVVKAEMDQPPDPDRPTERVLVIGGAGFIGSALIPRLLETGAKVRILDRLMFGTEPLADVLTHPNLEVIEADFRQIDEVVAAMASVDAVVHLGAIVGDPACEIDEQLTLDVNLMATKMIAEVAKGAGVSRFVFASTCSVYGARDDMLDEYSYTAPVSLYARSKIACERGLMSMAGPSFAPTILRFATIFGLSGRMRFDLVVNLLTAKAMVEREITVFGGDQWRPFLHVSDAGKAISEILAAPIGVVQNQIYNVGSDDMNYTIGQVGEMIERLVPTAALKNMGSDVDRRNYRVAFAKIRRHIGFEPDWSLERGIFQVIDALKNHRVTDYRDPRYSNVRFLRDEGASSLLTAPDRGPAWDLTQQSSSGR